MTSKGWKSLLPNLPHDDDGDGDALRRLAADGSDLSKPMEIDFAVGVPDGEEAAAVAAAVVPLGFKSHVYYDAETDSWTTNCTRTMVPRYAEIIAIQNQLDELSKPFGGKSDGWGSFGNAPDPKAGKTGE